MKKNVLKNSVAIAAMGIGLSSVASAQALLEEIMVTAQKREQSLADVGIAISAYSGEQIRALGFTELTDITLQVPNLQVLTTPGLPAVFNIRGVSQNDFADHLEAPVAVFMDEVYQSGLPALDTTLFDVERIEVLRGPQGTLFGRNATGGLIHYVSKRPTEEFGGSASLTLGQYSQIRTEGAINLPISSKVLTRFSFATNNHDGWVENRVGKDLHDVSSYGYRAQVKLLPSDNFDLLLALRGANNNDTTAGFQHDALTTDADGLGIAVPDNVDVYGTCAGCDPRGYRDDDGDVHAVEHDKLGMFKLDLVGGTATANLRLGETTLTSITDYYTYDKVYESDSDASPFDIARYDTVQDFKQFSQELRLAGSNERLNWVGGFYYLDIEAQQDQTAAAFGAFFSSPSWEVTTKSWAIFGQVDYKFAERWFITIGGRYTEDNKEMQYVRTDNFGGEDIFNADLYPDLAKKDYNNYSAKASLNWEPTEDVLAYLSFTRGHKGGSFAGPIFPPVVPESLPHDEEVIYSYEAGIKGSGFGGRMRYNAAIFYYDYNDYQAFSFANLVQAIYNVDAQVYGLEGEIQTNPIKNLDLSLGVTLLDAKAKDVELPSGRIADRNLPMSPDFSINGIARYGVPVAEGLVYAQFDFKYLDDFNFYVLNQPAMQEKGYFLGNVRVGYTSDDGKWGIVAAIRNVTDTNYRIYANDISVLGHSLNNYGAPRWASVTFNVNW